MASIRQCISCLLVFTLAAPAFGQAPAPGATPGSIDPKDFVEVLLMTGSQARAALDRPTYDANFRAATAYMQGKNLRLAPEFAVLIQFTRISTKDRYTLSFVPYTEATPRREWHHLILTVDGPQGTSCVGCERGRLGGWEGG
jgi:hypothetical protein